MSTRWFKYPDVMPSESGQYWVALIIDGQREVLIGYNNEGFDTYVGAMRLLMSPNSSIELIGWARIETPSFPEDFDLLWTIKHLQ